MPPFFARWNTRILESSCSSEASTPRTSGRVEQSSTTHHSQSVNVCVRTLSMQARNAPSGGLKTGVMIENRGLMVVDANDHWYCDARCAECS